jgi:ribosomal protein S18 acetylase RimI-like enzyme
VPGLAAKPIVDLQVSVERLDQHERYVQPLERLGYMYVPEPASPGRRFFAKPPQRPRTHHVHVCAAGSEDEFRHIVVRDFLRAHSSEAASYEAAKRKVAARHPQDRLAYIEGKHAHVEALEQRALEWARTRHATIRPLEARDHEHVQALLKVLSEDALVSSDDAPTYVAEIGDQVVGMVTLCVFTTLTGSKAYLDHLVVAPDFRRRGVGRALVEHAIDQARVAGASRIDLTANTSKQAGHTLYRSLGFQRRDTDNFRLSLTDLA